MWQNSRRRRSPRPGMSQKWTKTATPQSSQIWRATKRAVKKLMRLMRDDWKRPDGTAILPWSRGKTLAWDVTVPGTFADAHVINSARKAGAAAEHAATKKISLYSRLTSMHVCMVYSVVIKTVETCHQKAVELMVKEIGRRTTSVNGDERETSYLFLQYLSVALKRRNAINFVSVDDDDRRRRAK